MRNVVPMIKPGADRTTKASHGNHLVKLGQIDWNADTQTLYLHCRLNGKDVSPCPSVCFDVESSFYAQNMERWLKFLDAMDLSQEDFQQLQQNNELRSLYGASVTLVVDYRPASKAKNQKERRLYSFEPFVEEHLKALGISSAVGFRTTRERA